MKNLYTSRFLKKLSAAVCAAAVISAGFPACRVYAGETASSSSYLENPSISILKAEKYDNLDEDPILNGGEVRFLANLGGEAQQLSAVFKSSDGHVLVVDGGNADDEEHLVSVIKELGGTVDAWLITHPHSDHAGALLDMLTFGRSDISINNFYCSFLEQEWYNENDEEGAGVAWNLRQQFEKLPEGVVHSSCGAGDAVIISEALNFTVLNDPQKSTGFFAGNGSGLLFDIVVDGYHFTILGDMGAEVGDRLLEAGTLEGITCDFVQMAHHGQRGVSAAFYTALDPTYCIWPTNSYIYYAKGLEQSGLDTINTKIAVSKLKVKVNYVTIGRDVIIK